MRITEGGVGGGSFRKLGGFFNFAEGEHFSGFLTFRKQFLLLEIMFLDEKPSIFFACGGHSMISMVRFDQSQKIRMDTVRPGFFVKFEGS